MFPRQEWHLSRGAFTQAASRRKFCTINAMTIVVQNSATKHYLTEHGNWSPSLAAAKLFSSSYEAFAWCNDHPTHDCDVVLDYGGNQPDWPTHSSSLP